MVKINNNKINTNLINYFNIEINFTELIILSIIILLLVIILLFKKIINKNIEKICLFLIIFIILLLITNNILLAIIISIIIFFLISLNNKYKNTIESFQSSDATTEPKFDTNIFNTDEFKKSSESIQELLKKVNGGIELKDTDVVETDVLNIDVKKYDDDNKPNALKIAQKETYELINTVNALKDTITTLAPVLQEGKKLMNIFENLKI